MAFGLGFGGGFASGLASGVSTGMKLGSLYEAQQLKTQRQEALDSAKTDYDNQVANTVNQQEDAYKQTGIEAPFDREKATTEAKSKIGNFTDFLYNQKMPGIIDGLVAKGDIAGAEALRKWAEDGKERAFMSDFGKTLGYWNAGKASGDYSSFANSAVKLLNKGNYGITATGHEFVKDKDGNTTGLTFNLKGPDGNEFSHTFNSMDEAASFVAAQGSPENRVKQWQSQQEAATKLKATLATEQGKAAIGIGKENAIEDNKQKNRKELQGIRADDQMRLEATKSKSGATKEQQENDYVIGLLKDRGFGDEEVSQYIANKYLGGYRKGKSPQEFAQQIVVELSKDPMNAGKSREEIMRQAQGLVDIANELGKTNQPAGRKPAAAPKQDMPVYR